MQSLQKQFHDFIQTYQLVKKGEKVLLAVSGGLDSMVMANLFLSEKIPFAIAHCNYGLRGEESDEDEAFVLDWADKNDINCYVKAFEISGKSTQVEARKVRYEWFRELISENGYDKIATAHHLNDSLETLLINLSRGTGIKGIAGISVKNVEVIRPLMFTEKQKLYDYAMDHELDWREDSSNAKTDYDRNLLRHDVIPELLKLNPSLLRTFGLTMERLTHASDIISHRVEEIKSKYLIKKENGFQLDLSWVDTFSDELILSEILAPFGVNYATAKEIFEAQGKAGRSFPSEGWLLTMDRNTIFIDADVTAESVDVVAESTGEYQVGFGKLIIEKISNNDVVFEGSNNSYFDARMLKFPLRIRTWRAGDRFQPLGMQGEKKISDFLIDEKIPLALKDKVLVVESGERIAWVVGMRISEAFKVLSEEKEVIKMTFNDSNQ